MATSNKLISVQHLVKEYNHGTVKALNDCSLDIAQGEVVAIIGPSGSGKSTLLRSLNLLEEPTGGQIFFDGVDLGAGGRQLLRVVARINCQRRLQGLAVDEVVVVERFVVGKDRLRAAEVQDVGGVLPTLGRKINAVREAFQLVLLDKLIKRALRDAVLYGVLGAEHAGIIDAILYGVHGITNFRAYIINEISMKVHSF